MANENEEVEKKGPNVILVALITMILTALLVIGGLFAINPNLLGGDTEKVSQDTAEDSTAMKNPKAPSHKIVELFDGMVTIRENRHLNFRLVVDIPDEKKQEEGFTRSKEILQNEVIQYVSNQTPSKFEGSAGKQETLEELKLRFNRVKKIKKLEFSINELYFTKFELP